MNLFAITVMFAFTAGWFVIAVGLAVHGPLIGLAALIIGTAALFLFVYWARWRAGDYKSRKRSEQA